jgi:hypothetical protein
MNAAILTVVVGVLLTVVLAMTILLLRRGNSSNVSVRSTIQHMKAIGHLSVFKVITKEIVTATDHSFGDFGKKYLRWIMTNKKMAMIFEFEIDFRYDLRSSEFDIIGASIDSFIIKMPPCLYETHIRDIEFYDEQSSRLMPWLLPDLVNGFLPTGFSEADKNRLVDAAKEHAVKQARDLITHIQPEVQNSAKAALQSIGRAFGAKNIAFEFLPQGEIKLEVGLTGKADA